MKAQPALTFGEIVSSIISLDQFSKKKDIREDDETQPLGPDSDYNSANSESDEQQELDVQMSSVGTEFCWTKKQKDNLVIIAVCKLRCRQSVDLNIVFDVEKIALFFYVFYIT